MSKGAFYKNTTSTSQVALRTDDKLQTETELDPRQASSTASGNANGRHESPSSSSLSSDFYCGWFRCRPRWLQKLSTPPWLLFCLCLATFIQGMIVNGFPPGSITSIERRFQLSSKQTGVLSSTYEVTNIIFVLFVVYIGGRQHKLRWVAAGMVLLAVSSVMFALPHFTTPPYEYVTNDTSAACSTNDAETSCSGDDSGSDLSNYIYLFCASQVVAGFGSLPLYTLGVIAMDESVSNKNYGPYFGIFYAVQIFGPGVGFLVSGSLLNIYTELETPPGVELSPTDPGWVGAWWLGFLICAAVSFLVAMPLSLFPRELPTTAQIRSEKSVQAHANSGVEETSRPGFGKSPADLLRVLRYLLVNPTLVFTVLGGAADALIVSSFNTFLPKFIENQFAVTSGLATILAGAIIIVGGIVGALTGGCIVRALRENLRSILRYAMVGTVLSALLLLGLLWHCPQQRVAGVTVTYDGSLYLAGDEVEDVSSLTSSCNQNCSCAMDQFLPVCAENAGIQYFTPCHAGCTEDYGNQTYGNCLCLASLEGDTPDLTTLSGPCNDQCSFEPYIFALICIFVVLLIYNIQMAELNVVLKCVPESQRSMALGLDSLIKRALGSFPGPIIFGAIIDEACLLWQDTCGERGSCWIYDNDNFGWRLTVITVAVKVFAFIMYTLAMCCYTPVDASDREKADAGRGQPRSDSSEMKGEQNLGTNFE